MKYLLISDTHGQLEKTRNLILQYPLMDGYFHMGDVGFALSHLEQFHIVRGNHDRHTSLPMELRFTLGERKVLCMHGNRFDEETVQEVLHMQHLSGEEMMEECMRRLYEKLSDYTKRQGCDTLFFGHTHEQCCVEYEGVTLINPGSLSFGMNGAGYAIVEIEGKHIHAEMKTLPNL